MLGLLNAKGQVRVDAPYSAEEWTAQLLAALEMLCGEQCASVGHLELLVATLEGKVKASLPQAQSLS